MNSKQLQFQTRPSTKTKVVEIRNLNYTFGQGSLKKQILFDLSLTLKTGEIVILKGPSGSGKSTLLTLIGGLRSAQTGTLKVFGMELVGAKKNQLIKTRKNIGYIFQAHNLLESLTARQNVQLSLELHNNIFNFSTTSIKSRSINILKSVGLEEYVDYYPHNLSVGQKQRVAIARALVSHPKIVLADEPTASLDSKSGRDVVGLMIQLAREQDCTILIVTHDNRILDVANRILELEDGTITE